MMSYQIKYTALGTAKYIPKIRRHSHRIIFIFAAVTLFALLVWSSGMDWSVTMAALEEMAASVSRGEGLQDAFSAFCIEILQGVQPG